MMENSCHYVKPLLENIPPFSEKKAICMGYIDVSLMYSIMVNSKIPLLKKC